MSPFEQIIYDSLIESNTHNLDSKSVSHLIYSFAVPVKLEDVWSNSGFYSIKKQYLTYYIWDLDLNGNFTLSYESSFMKEFIKKINPHDNLKNAFIYEIKHALLYHRDLFVPSLLYFYTDVWRSRKFYYISIKMRWLIYLIYNEFDLYGKGNIIPIFQGDLHLTQEEENQIQPLIKKHDIPL